ncbi:3beta-hydroxysteroid-dehydrogenasedecarboxylase isoform 1, partial [Nicotiana attenuata]
MGEGEEKWCVVTGGRGFAARHLVEMLIRYEIHHVRIADLGPSIKLEPAEEKACEGAEVVFHMAAPDSSINNHQLHYSVNVQG